VFYRLLPGSARSGVRDDPRRVARQGSYVAEQFRAKPQLLSSGNAAAPQRLPLVRVHMTANGPQVTGGQPRLPALRSRATADGPRTSLQLAEECARLRAEIDQLRQDNRRLSDENARLRGEAPRSSVGELDDSVQRFKLLELE